jgi:solute:Na+ symporter, SSS family
MCILPFFLVLIISVAASYFAAKKKADYFLASRSLKWPVLIGTFLGAQIGGGFILGNTEASFHHGLFGSMYGVGIALGMLLLGSGFGARLRALQIGTLPELLKHKYGSSSFQTISAIVSVLSLAGGLMCQAIGLKMFLSSLGFGGHLAYFCAWYCVVLYTTYGGLLAVVWTDTIQAIIMIAILAATFAIALAPQMPMIIAHTAAMDQGLTGISLSALLFPLCFIFVQQDMAQRCFAAKTPKDASISCIITAIALLIFTAIPTMCGILGHALGLAPEDGSIFMQVIQKIGHPAVFIMAATAVLLAIISTASAILLALSSNVANDMAQGKKVHLITLLAGVAASFGPYISNDIIGGLVMSYEISVGALFIPVICAVLSSRPTLPKEAAIGAAILGSLGTVLSQWSQMSYLGLAAPFILSPLGFGIGLRIARRRLSSVNANA